jgi:hypothetical protein
MPRQATGVVLCSSETHGARWRSGSLACFCGTLLTLALALPAPAADTREPVRPKDAAEEVQEGNVDHWIKYYQRERGAPAVPTPTARPDPQPVPEPEPKPGEQR